MTTEQEAFTPLQWFQTLYSTLNQDDDFFVLFIYFHLDSLRGLKNSVIRLMTDRYETE